ncbi:hypothetical protein [Streptosporangium saharense]|uniref:hypothetical protein n=1 Tax=Streptosporangium saharense TaxID=1706840 RepID=UPI00343A69A5
MTAPARPEAERPPATTADALARLAEVAPRGQHETHLLLGALAVLAPEAVLRALTTLVEYRAEAGEGR